MSLVRFALIALIFGCDHQYVGIPGAQVVAGSPNYTYDDLYVGDATPSAAIVAGSPQLTPDSPVTVHIDFSAVVAFEVTTIVFLELDTMEGSMGGHWEYDVSDEERAAGFAEPVIEVLDKPPAKEWCQHDYRGIGRCYQEVDHGLDGLGEMVADDHQTSPFGELPITLDPLNPPGGDACAAFTVEQCCADQPGIDIVACWVSDPCGCPGDLPGEPQSNGTTMCTCPG